MAAAAVCGQQSGVDPMTCTWTGDWGPSPGNRNQVTLKLKWSSGKLTGTINPGPNAIEIQKTTFDPKAGAVHFEADARRRRGTPLHYLVDGKWTKVR
jgi:hypothetical protein